jgi:tRNA dimethylallyltransferase
MRPKQIAPLRNLALPGTNKLRERIYAVITEYGLLQRFRKRYNLLVVLGPTASGKTELAVRLARRISGEIISADSRQVYRGMDLGTGKDLSLYRYGEAIVPCHLIDILDPGEEFSVFDYQQLFYRCFQEITERFKIPLLVGGTGLYMEAVIRGYRMPAVPENRKLRDELEGEGIESLRHRLLAINSDVHNKSDLMERKRLIRAIEIAEFTRDNPCTATDRIPICPLVMGIRCEREDLRRRITTRLHARLAEGLIDEVRSLHERGIGWQRIESFGLEYRYVGRFLQGIMIREEMIRTLNTRIHQYAKRQETWFKRMERNGVLIHWIDEADDSKVLSLIECLTA